LVASPSGEEALVGYQYTSAWQAKFLNLLSNFSGSGIGAIDVPAAKHDPESRIPGGIACGGEMQCHRTDMAEKRRRIASAKPSITETFLPFSAAYKVPLQSIDFEDIFLGALFLPMKESICKGK
jgi:hypothetical protein